MEANSHIGSCNEGMSRDFRPRVCDKVDPVRKSRRSFARTHTLMVSCVDSAVTFRGRSVETVPDERLITISQFTSLPHPLIASEPHLRHVRVVGEPMTRDQMDD